MELAEMTGAIPADCDYRLITTEEQLDELCDEINNAKLIAVDTETEGLAYEDVIVGLCISTAPKTGRYIPIRHSRPISDDSAISERFPNQLDPTLVFAKLGPLLERVPSTGHNVKFDLKMLWKEGVAVNFIHDTLIQAHLLGRYNSGERGLKDLVARHLGHKMADLDSLFEPVRRGRKKIIAPATLSPQQIFLYGCEDGDYSLQLFNFLYPIMQKSINARLYEIEMRLVKVVAEMEALGVPTSSKFLSDRLIEATALLKRLDFEIQEEIRRAVGEPDLEVNLSSPKQLGEVIYEKLGLPVEHLTATGAPSTAGAVLEAMADKHPIMERIHTYRLLKKLTSAFLEKNLGHVHEDGRIRGNFNQLGTASGRFSSSQPNLQQIPKDQTFHLWPADTLELSQIEDAFPDTLREIEDDEGKWEAYEPQAEEWGNYYLGHAIEKQFSVHDDQIWQAWKCKTRQFITASKDHYILEADYSQIELRIMAGESQEPTLLDAYNSGDDVHRRTAAVIFGVPFENVTDKQRHIGKTINFSLLYGAGPHKISQTLNMPLNECKDIVHKYFQNLPLIQTWINTKKYEARVDGYAKTRFGRIRYFPLIKSPDQNMRAKEEREAVNHNIQGAAADVMKMALIRIDSRMKKYFGHKVKIVCTVHDSVILEVHDSCDPAQVIKVLKDAMEIRPFANWPTLQIDVGVGPSWSESEKFKGNTDTVEFPETIDLDALPKVRVRRWGREREGHAPDEDYYIEYVPPVEEVVEVEYEENADIASDEDDIIEVETECSWILEIDNEITKEQATKLAKFLKEKKVEEGTSSLTIVMPHAGTTARKKASGSYNLSFRDEIRLRTLVGQCKLNQDLHNFDTNELFKRLNLRKAAKE